MTYIAVKELSPALREALGLVGYGRADIEMEAATAVDIGNGGGAGLRAFAIVVNLDTGARVVSRGSWGGPNPFTTNPVDAGFTVDVPANGAVVRGSYGYGPTYARIYAHPDAFGHLLPPTEEDVLSDLERSALYCFAAIKGGEYRRQELRQRRVPDTVVDGLVERGYLKRNRAGATQITTKGRNAARGG
jgi:hypothetical protein